MFKFPSNNYKKYIYKKSGKIQCSSLHYSCSTLHSWSWKVEEWQYQHQMKVQVRSNIRWQWLMKHGMRRARLGRLTFRLGVCVWSMMNLVIVLNWLSHGNVSLQKQDPGSPSADVSKKEKHYFLDAHIACIERSQQIYQSERCTGVWYWHIHQMQLLSLSTPRPKQQILCALTLSLSLYGWQH